MLRSGPTWAARQTSLVVLLGFLHGLGFSGDAQAQTQQALTPSSADGPTDGSFDLPRPIDPSDAVADWLAVMKSAMSGRSVDAVADLIDGRRMLDLPLQRGLLGDDPRAAETVMATMRRRVPQIELAMAEQMRLPAAGIAWERAVILNERVSDTGDRTVYGIFYDAYDYPLRLRWWLTPDDDGSLRVYDMESVDSSMRFSDGIAMGLIAVIENDPEMIEAVQRLTMALQSIDAVDTAEIETLVVDIDSDLLPPMLEAFRQLLLAGVEMEKSVFNEGPPSDALTHANRALELHPDLHAARLLRATIHNDSGDFSEALVDLDAYHRLLGADTEMLIERAYALDGLSREPEAIDALRAAIGLSKQQGFAVSHLLHLLPIEDRDEGIKAYNDLLDPEEWIEFLADDLWSYGDVAALEQLRTAHAARCPEDEWGLSYLDDTIVELRSERKPLPELAE